MDVCVGVGWSGTVVNDLIIEPCHEKKMSFRFQTRLDTNQAVQPQELYTPLLET